MTRERRTIIGGGPGDIQINGRSWETWTVGELFDLAADLGDARAGAWRLTELASDSHGRFLALEEYSADLEREIAAYRAIGFLSLIIAPDDSPTVVEYRNAMSKADCDEVSARKAIWIEFKLGCELAGICPEGGNIEDPNGVTPLYAQ